jgi:hypothetical protein
MKMNKLAATGAMLLAGTSISTTDAFAWGATGHRMISEMAMEMLPDDLPAFLLGEEVPVIIGELGREPDRYKGSGQTHDQELNPGHFVDLDDEGRILGGPTLAELPVSRSEYDAMLNAVGVNQYQAGYLPYTLVGAYQQVREGFAIWRGLVAAEEAADTPEEKARYALDRQIREMLIVHDIGIWSHYVADSTMPLHLSIHFNGWGEYPNPQNYSTARDLHARFEGAFVAANISADEVAAAVPAPRERTGEIWDITREYLLAHYAEVIPLYELEGRGAFAVENVPPEGEAFIIAQMAAAVAELRDLVVFAWQDSADEPFGYPNITVQAIEGGEDPIGAIFGLD